MCNSQGRARSGDGLADLVKSGLTPKGGKAPRVRADTFGYIQRCWPHPSPVDAEEARAVGRYAAELAAKGDARASVILIRTSNAPDAYASECAPRRPLRRSRAAAATCRLSSSQGRTT